MKKECKTLSETRKILRKAEKYDNSNENQTTTTLLIKSAIFLTLRGLGLKVKAKFRRN